MAHKNIENGGKIIKFWYKRKRFMSQTTYPARSPSKYKRYYMDVQSVELYTA